MARSWQARLVLDDHYEAESAQAVPTGARV